MANPQIPDELKGLVSGGEWDKISQGTKVGNRTVVFEHPGAVRDFMKGKIFTFDDLLEFSWQELQTLCINAEQVKDLAGKGFSPQDFHQFDSLQLIELLHHKDNLLLIVESGVAPDQLAAFSGYQLKLILEHPRAVSSILKKFESAEDLLKLRWNWVEEMLIRPEETLMLLEHGVEWEQLVTLPDWDFGWFLQHVPEIVKLLDMGVPFETIGKINAEKLKTDPSTSALTEKGVERAELGELDFWQLFMVLSHMESFSNLIDEGISKKLLFKIDSHNMEIVFENLDFFLAAYKDDAAIFRGIATLKHSKMALLLRHKKEFLRLIEKGAGLKDLSSLSDRQFEVVMEHLDKYMPIIQLARKLGFSYESIFEVDLDDIDQLTAYPQQLEMLIKSGLNLNDLTRFPAILTEVLRHAESILKLQKSGVSPKELFRLSKDQVAYAFARFPLLEIMPELQITINDLEPFLIEEFKLVLSNLKSLSILKKGGVDSRQLTEIPLSHLRLVLDRPDYVLPLIQKGVPLYRFSHIDADQVKSLLDDPLSDDSQKIIQKLFA